MERLSPSVLPAPSVILDLNLGIDNCPFHRLTDINDFKLVFFGLH